MRVFKKVKITGDIISVYQFEKGFQTGYSKTFGLYKETGKDGKVKYYKADEDGVLQQVLIGRQSEGTKTDHDTREIRIRTLLKDKNIIKDIVNTNCYFWKDSHDQIIRPKFLTLTFKENIKDLKVANDLFKKFIMRLNYSIRKTDKNYIGVQYTTVIEFQDKNGRGAVHFHSLLYNMPLIAWSKIKDMWGNGGCWIEGFKDKEEKLVKFKYDEKKKCFQADGKDIRNVGAYITKTMSYMVKNIDDYRLKGRKCCFSSKNLLKPIVYNDIKENKKEIELLEKSISADNLTFANVYENEYIGKCSFQEYNIKFKTNTIDKYVKNSINDNIKDNWIKNKDEII